MHDFLTSHDWNGVRDWLATIGGLIALFIATNTYRNNVRNKREKQARLVYTRLKSVQKIDPDDVFTLRPPDVAAAAMNAKAKFVRDDTDGFANLAHAEGPVLKVTIVIYNGSKEVIGPLRIRLIYTDTNWPESPGVTVDTVAPESTSTVVLIGNNDLYPFTPVLIPNLLFRDSAGSWWTRGGTNPVEWAHDDPENPSPGSTMHSMGVALGTGYGSHDPKKWRVPLRARLHRVGRWIRRKPQIP